jgi:anti-sigma-K factor RskA
VSAAPWPVDPAAVALDLLEPDELPIAEALLRDDPAFAAEVERLLNTTERLAAVDTLAWSPPPAPALDVARATGRRPKAVAARRSRRRRWRLAFGSAVALAVVVIGLIVLSGAGGPADPPPPVATALTLRPVAGAGGAGEIVVRASGAAELRASGLRPNGTHEHYEAWLADRGGRMVPMGSFRVGADGTVDVHMTVDANLATFAFVDISVEPDGGPPRHSGTSILRARI